MERWRADRGLDADTALLITAAPTRSWTARRAEFRDIAVKVVSYIFVNAPAVLRIRDEPVGSN